MNEAPPPINFTNREVACLIWNTMYPDRRPFHKLEESAKKEWETLSAFARDVLHIEDCSYTTIKEIKNQLKL